MGTRIEAAQLEIQSLRSEDAVAPKIKVLVQQLPELAPLVIQHESSLKELSTMAPLVIQHESSLKELSTKVNASPHLSISTENRTMNIPAAMEVKPELVRPPAQTSTLPAPSAGRRE